MRVPSLSIRTRLTLWYSGVLLAIVVTISVLSYSWLRLGLLQDLDASLLTVAQVVRDTGSQERAAGDQEALLRELLGPELYDKFFQLLDPDGRPRATPPPRRSTALPLSPAARARAALGQNTFETVALTDSEPVRVLTMPIVHQGRVVEIVQVGMLLRRARATLDRYVDTLTVLIPLGVGLAALGGAIIARVALRPLDRMTRTARRISAEDLSQRVERPRTGDELDRLAETMNDMLGRLEQAFAQSRRFAADAAHELRTPLAALRGTVEVALRGDRSPDEYRQVLASSLEEVERLIRLSEDLLLFSRALAAPEPGRALVDLEALLLDVFDVGARLGQAAGVSVRIETAAPALVQGDATALRRALLNLVENAVKYTPRGGKVELSLVAGDGTATLAVSDTGIGVEAADAERIFEPFVRLDAARSRDTGGAGLGLAIARSIIVAHRGTLSVESRPGSGSCFSIRLPLASA
ncbi:MAG TPA: heavy metal sensor histidine kinase [Candidatus Nitrosotalea sp.]|nr:heavy metal sensor histidine kinase [Candidatus Nitrosotalea sp.]